MSMPMIWCFMSKCQTWLNLKDQMNTNYIWIKITKNKKKIIICFEKSFNLNSCKIQIFVGMHEEFNINSHYAHGDHFSCAFYTMNCNISKPLKLKLSFSLLDHFLNKTCKNPPKKNQKFTFWDKKKMKWTLQKISKAKKLFQNIKIIDTYFVHSHNKYG
jgi:hypothetical protein